MHRLELSTLDCFYTDEDNFLFSVLGFPPGNAQFQIPAREAYLHIANLAQ